jgi:hypothetical protein
LRPLDITRCGSTFLKDIVVGQALALCPSSPQIQYSRDLFSLNDTFLAGTVARAAVIEAPVSLGGEVLFPFCFLGLYTGILLEKLSEA